MRLAGIVSFDQAEIKFQKGLTAILGRNLNRRDTGASNGSGKSLLMGALPNALFDSHSHITKNGRSVTKGLFRKNGKIEVDFTPHGSKSKFTFTKMSSKVALAENGTDLTSRIARDSLKARLDITEEEFWATVYLDSRRPNSFLMGSSADRFAFITSLFRLDNIDERRRIFNRRIQDLKEIAAQLTVLQSEFNQSKQEFDSLPKIAPDALAEKQAKLKSAQEAVQEANIQQTAHEAYGRYVAARKMLSALPTPEVSDKDAKAAIRAWDQYEADVRAWEKASKRAHSLKKERDDLGVDPWVSWYDEMCQRRESIRKANIRVKERPNDVEDPGPGAKKAFEKQDQIERKLNALRGQLSERKQTLREFDAAFHEDTECECPSCHQTIDAKTRKSIRSQLTEAVETLTADLERFKKHQAAAQSYATYKQYLVDMREFKLWCKLSDNGFVGYPFDLVERHMAITKVLQQSVGSKPTAPDALSRDEANEILSQWSKKREAKQAVEMLGDPEKPKWSLEKAKGIAERASAAVTRIMAELPTMQMKAELRKQAASKLRRLSKEIEEAKQAVTDLPVYELLAEAFSPQGVKLLITKSIASKLEKNLNRFAKTVYEGEGFRFEVNVEAGKFEVMVHRRNMTACDVRNMSGAESRLFILVFLLALLPMIPARRRINTVILDEPCIGMDDQNRERFRSRLLPALLKIVPSVIVVTPDLEDVPQWAKKLTVVKQGTTSSLIEGVYREGALRVDSKRSVRSGKTATAKNTGRSPDRRNRVKAA